VKVRQYLAKLSSAGHSETEELTYYGLGYLRILHEGPILGTRAAEVAELRADDPKAHRATRSVVQIPRSKCRRKGALR
jgi:hypothetical protein